MATWKSMSPPWNPQNNGPFQNTAQRGGTLFYWDVAFFQIICQRVFFFFFPEREKEKKHTINSPCTSWFNFWNLSPSYHWTSSFSSILPRNAAAYSTMKATVPWFRLYTSARCEMARNSDPRTTRKKGWPPGWYAILKKKKKKIRKFRVTGKTLSFQIDGKFAEMHSISQS